MAQLIHCDYTDCPALADVLISRIANGETMAWCDDHYLEMSAAIVAAAEAIAAGMDPGQLGNPVLADAADHMVGEAAADDAASRLESLPAQRPAFPTSPESSAADDPAPGPPTKPAGGRESPKRASEAPPEAIAALGANLGPMEATAEADPPA